MKYFLLVLLVLVCLTFARESDFENKNHKHHHHSSSSSNDNDHDDEKQKLKEAYNKLMNKLKHDPEAQKNLKQLDKKIQHSFLYNIIKTALHKAHEEDEKYRKKHNRSHQNQRLTTLLLALKKLRDQASKDGHKLTDKEFLDEVKEHLPKDLKKGENMSKDDLDKMYEKLIQKLMKSQRKDGKKISKEELEHELHSLKKLVENLDKHYNGNTAVSNYQKNHKNLTKTLVNLMKMRQNRFGKHMSNEQKESLKKLKNIVSKFNSSEREAANKLMKEILDKKDMNEDLLNNADDKRELHHLSKMFHEILKKNKNEPFTEYQIDETDKESDHHHHKSSGLLIGGIIGILLLVLGLAFFAYRRYKNKTRSGDSAEKNQLYMGYTDSANQNKI